MDDDALAEALTVLRSADALRHELAPGSRDRVMIEGHILELDREIHLLVTAGGAAVDGKVERLRAVSRTIAVQVGEIQATLRG